MTPAHPAGLAREPDQPHAQDRRPRRRRRHRAGRGARRSVVDNTFATPFFQRPLALGIDVVCHSTTKYLNGHSDVVGGAVLTSDDGALPAASSSSRTRWAACPRPWTRFLVLRGLKTLHVRMERHAGERLPRWPASSRGTPRWRRSPTRACPPTRSTTLARRQMSGLRRDAHLRHPGRPAGGAGLPLGRSGSSRCAESLGGVESLIEHPAIMTHASVPAGDARRAGHRRRLHPRLGGHRERRRPARRPRAGLRRRPRRPGEVGFRDHEPLHARWRCGR